LIILIILVLPQKWLAVLAETNNRDEILRIKHLSILKLNLLNLVSLLQKDINCS